MTVPASMTLDIRCIPEPILLFGSVVGYHSLVQDVDEGLDRMEQDFWGYFKGKITPVVKS